MDIRKNKKQLPVLSVIYIYYNTPSEISESIKSLRIAAKRIRYEIIIVDNNSHIPLPISLKKHVNITYIKNKKNVGYGGALNIGVKKAKGKYLLCSNTDTIYRIDSVKLLLDKLISNKKIGVIGPKMINSEKKRLDTTSKLPLFPRNIILYTFLRTMPFFSSVEASFHYRDSAIRVREVEVLGGACMMFSREAFEKVGGFDTGFFLYFEESDICKRIKSARFQVIYYPKSVITHLVGRSLADKEKIRKYFEKSRFYFIQKHQSVFLAYFSETLITLLRPVTIALIGILSLSLIVNLYKISSLMMFYGDFGRDMLSARDMLLTGTIPLLGIPSSVVWLSQGPLSIYLIGFSYVVGGYFPVVPAIFYAVIGSVTCLLVYKLGLQLFNRFVGVLSALIFVSSPLVIINSRIPYHHAPIPFFSAVFFLSLYAFIKKQTKIPLFFTGFSLGLLFQLELSNGVLFFLLCLLFFYYKISITKKKVLVFLTSFILGILPFVLYDITHRFIQTVGFSAWVANRIRLFFGLTVSGNSTTSHAPGAIQTIWENLVRFVYPGSDVISIILISVSVIYLLSRVIFLKRKKGNEIFLTFCLAVPFLGFIIHARPGMAYFPLVFPLLAVLIGELFYSLSRRIKMTLLLFVLLVISNITFVITNNYFLSIDGKDGSTINYWNYGLGVSLKEQQEVVAYLKTQSLDGPIQIKSGGFLNDFETSIDNYHYLLWQNGINVSDDGKVYVIYQNKSEIENKELIVFQTEHVFITTK